MHYDGELQRLKFMDGVMNAATENAMISMENIYMICCSHHIKCNLIT